MGPSMEFLKLGSFDTLYRHFPPVITHVLKVGGWVGTVGCWQPAASALPWQPVAAAGGGALLAPLNFACLLTTACSFQRFMVRYTKMGMLDGETNLQLPPITERLVEVRRGRCRWR